MSEAMTQGVHHVGLSVLDVGVAERFFVDALGWTVAGGVPSYPAVFVSDGTTMVTLWQVADPTSASRFDRRANVGLHHLALKVADREALNSIYHRLRDYDGVRIEFAPQPMREGSRVTHFICAMPGGPRVEFATAVG
jgi:catechol 2,3-dioxygenase-like lactoylglutathione lyase family enzyme